MRMVVLALVLLTGIARADDADIAEALRLERSLEYDKALAIVEGAIAKGTADRDQLVALHVMAGRLAAGLDKPDIAEDHFARALSLDPTRTLPEGTSPKITGPFEAARAKAQPLTISARIVGKHIQAVVESDPLHLVAKQETVIVDEGEREQARVLDEHGNVLWSKYWRFAVPQPPPVVERPIYRRGVLWGSFALTGLVTAGVGALEFRAKQHEWNRLRDEDGMHDYSELHAVETSAHRWAYVTYAGLGVTALSIAGAAVFVPRGGPAPIAYASAHDAGIGIVGRF